MEIANSVASPAVNSSTEASAAGVGGRCSRSNVLATGVSISARMTAPAVGIRKSRAM